MPVPHNPIVYLLQFALFRGFRALFRLSQEIRKVIFDNRELECECTKGYRNVGMKQDRM
jgi:hypothetical protein